VSDTPGLPPGIEVIELTPRSPLGLPKFPYRSLNTTIRLVEFGNLQIGASFVYRRIACYKIASDTALSTTTGICYFFGTKTVVEEILFPERGEIFGEHGYIVASGVISGSEWDGMKPLFHYFLGSDNATSRYATLCDSWYDHNGIRITEIGVIGKTFLCR